MALTFWHNPRCSTSRKALALLEDRGLHPQIRRYLEDPPSRDELVALALPARSLIRWKDAPDLPRDLDDAALLDHLAAHPRLIERPILIGPQGARIGRPPEAVLDAL
ncbi:arsenate reductase family protein [Gemmobacter sp.]|uniref:arsenate reductase family protein n=1 Tax=Gemmobacter sp. TaxID=1898957 RepID=UPI002AFE8A78|nr:arsenate reductase family protein [Gemmobacter sp.]